MFDTMARALGLFFIMTLIIRRATIRMIIAIPIKIIIPLLSRRSLEPSLETLGCSTDFYC